MQFKHFLDHAPDPLARDEEKGRAKAMKELRCIAETHPKLELEKGVLLAERDLTALANILNSKGRKQQEAGEGLLNFIHDYVQSKALPKTDKVVRGEGA